MKGSSYSDPGNRFSTYSRRSWLFFLTVAAVLAVASGSIIAQQISRSANGGKAPAKTAGRKASRATPKPEARSGIGYQQQSSLGPTQGVPQSSKMGVQETTDQIMARQKAHGDKHTERLMPEHEGPARDNLPQNPNARPVATTPDLSGEATLLGPSHVRRSNDMTSLLAPQTVGLAFDGVTGPAETGAFPPDTMGAAGPTQIFVFVNGRLRTFNKTTGVADGFVNADPDVFFASVMTPVSPPVVLNFTSDPNVRYDRLTGRWFLSIIDVPCTNATCTTTAANRWLLAVSDAGSSNAISGATVWTFFFFQTDAANFCDYPSLGVDSKALYTGCDMFTAAGAFVGTNGYVVRKTSVTGAGPLVFTTFANLALGGGAGPFAPRGVDNYDVSSNEGYFIGVDNATFSTLMLRRVSDPGGTPAISGNISLTVSTTSSSIAIDHLGNTGGANGRIDALDDRLYAAHIRNGRLWTTHNIRVSSAGVASTAAQSREGIRWYELNGIRSTDNGGVPVVVQSGTIFDNAATLAAARAYLIPSVMISGQGHAALGYSTAGTPFHIDAATNGRLSGDTTGTLGAVNIFTASSTAYNPPGDPGPPRRWGDYSYTSLDPKDDMTMWTVQEYCNGTNTYGVRVARLLAPPPPPTNTASPAAIQLNNPSTNIVVTGLAPAGQGYYDPGANPAAPHTPFTHISASGVGIIVNSITYNTPTQVTLNVSTVGSTPGAKTVTITNPDGQTTTVQILTGPTAAPAAISGRIVTSSGGPVAGVVVRLSVGGAFEAITDSNGNYHFTGIDTGSFYTVTPGLANYHFSPASRSFSLVGDKTDAEFTAVPDTTIVANAIDTPEYFVRQQYLDFLGREPEAGGFNYWSDQVNACGGDADCMRERRIDVSAAFFMSQEFKDTGSFVYRLYRGTLGRQLRYSEFSADRAQVVGGPGLEASKSAFADAFVARSEFADKYQGKTTADAFVDALLQTMNDSAGVNLSSERAALISRYGEGANMNASRTLVVRQLIDNATFANAVYNQSFVAMQYFGYLHRTPDTEGLNFWVNVLNNDSDNYRGMVCSFITSTEYQRRFSSVVSHSNAECGR